nr:DMT family transporter [Roseomonas acroporae]
MCMVAATLCFSAMFALVKALGDRIHFAEMMFFRSLIALPVMFWMVTHVGGLRMLATKRLGGHALRAVTSFVAMSLGFYAATLLPLAALMGLTYTAPLFVTILSIPMLGEQVGRHRWGAVVVGFLGILVVAASGSGGTGPAGTGTLLLLGAFCAVLNGFFSALSTLQVRQLSATEPSATIVLWQSLLIALLTGLALPFIWVTPGWTEMGLLVLLGIVGGIGQLAWTEAYASAQASSLGVYTYSGIVWAMLLGWAVWGEVPGLGTLLGAALIIAAGLYILRRELLRKRLRAG